MIRHIFIGTFKEGIPAEIREKELADMKAMKEKIPGIAAQEVGFSTGWAGPEDQIVMTVDFASKEDFDLYISQKRERCILIRPPLFPRSSYFEGMRT